MEQHSKPEYIYGKNGVREVLKTGAHGTLYISTSINQRTVSDIISLAESLSIKIHMTDPLLFNKMFDAKLSQGITLKIDNPFPNSIDETALFSMIDAHEASITVLLLDGITDVGNYGAILRSALLFDVAAVILPKRNSAPLTAAVLSRSAGAASHITTAYVANLVSCIKKLKQRSFWVYGAHMDGTAIDTVSFDKRTAIILGSEHKGMRPLVEKSCDHLVSIPTNDKLDSLNVSVSAGIILYESARQKKG